MYFNIAMKPSESIEILHLFSGTLRRRESGELGAGECPTMSQELFYIGQSAE